MTEAALVALAIVLFAWSVFARRFERFNLSAPLVLTLSGFVLGNSSWGIVSVSVDSSSVHLLAELTLALLLFADASAVPLNAARHDLPLTARLLGIGLPLSIIAGTVIALFAFPSLPLALAGLIAASLAPTDAALSASVIADKRLPIGVRRVLNVESGLNDGIATPVVTLCIAAAATVLGVAQHEFDSGFGAVGELALGVLIGVGVGVVGGRVVALAAEHGWTEHGSRRIATLSLALVAFLLASEAGGNPFVAAFIGGLGFGAAARTAAAESVEFTELLGSLLSLALWFVFGAGFLLPALQDLDVRIALYAVASLTIVRMIPVAIALIGAGQDRATIAFVGWFGPRGLASVVFALLAVEDLGESDPRVMIAVHTIAITIALSILAHGITAGPLATRYVNAIPAPVEKV
jgi:NhaP-type Na+/H+ or K+/H+ antiporter